MSTVFAFFFFFLCSWSSERDQSLMLAPSPRQKPQLPRNDIRSAVLESFFERNNFDEKKQKKRNINGPSILSSVAVWVCRFVQDIERTICVFTSVIDFFSIT